MCEIEDFTCFRSVKYISPGVSLENRNDFIISAFTTLWGPRCPLSSFLLLREKSEKKLKYIRKGDSENIRIELTRKNRTEKSGRSYASKHRKNARAKPATAGEKKKQSRRVARLSNAQAWATHVQSLFTLQTADLYPSRRSATAEASVCRVLAHRAKLLH